MRSHILRAASPTWLQEELWRRAGIAPSLDLRFADNKALVNSVSGQNLITYSCASSVTYFDSTGTRQTAAVNESVFDHNPVTLESLGLRIWRPSINVLQNTAVLSTQSVTVTATTYTLSFYGTGTVTLSGASGAGPAVGGGLFPTQTVLTFTPTAGTLTLTVTGLVTEAQLETGSSATGYIPNTTTPGGVARAPMVASITGTNFSSWYRQDEGTAYVETRPGGFVNPDGISNGAACFSDGTTTERIRLSVASILGIWISGNTTQASLSSGAGFVANALFRAAAATKANNFAYSTNGNTVQSSVSGLVPSVSQLNIGSSNPASGFLDGTIRRLTYFPTRLPNTTLQQITQ